MTARPWVLLLFAGLMVFRVAHGSFVALRSRESRDRARGSVRFGTRGLSFDETTTADIARHDTLRRGCGTPNTRRRSSSELEPPSTQRGVSCAVEHGGAGEFARAQSLEGNIRVREGERFDLRAERYARDQLEERVTVGPREVRDRAERALSP